MAINPIKGEVPLRLKDGRAFVLVLDMEALVAAEAIYGKPLAKVMADVSAGFVGAIRSLLHGALQRHHPELPLADATAMFLTDGEAVSAALEQAASAAFPSAEGNGASPAPPRAKPRGKTSGGSGVKRG